MNILEEIAEYTKTRIEEEKRVRPIDEVKKKALSLPKGDFSFEKALKKDGISFICECKKASPSKWFLGKNEYLKEIAEKVSIPIILKDFTVDEYMIYEARILGASAVLLIVSILSESRIKEYLNICDELGISAIVECHDEKEIETALKAGARIIGVNNRNLKDFSVDISLGKRLRDMVPKDLVFVSESGIKSPEDIKALNEIGTDAVLVGETLMRAEDKSKALAILKGA